MSEEFTADRLREELKKIASKCTELETEILHKDETIRKFTAELAASQAYSGAYRVGCMTLEERVKRTMWVAE